LKKVFKCSPHANYLNINQSLVIQKDQYELY